MERKITVHLQDKLDMTIVHIIVKEAERFHSSSELSFNGHFTNLKSMKNSFYFFQAPICGEVTITCLGYDEFYALNQLTRVIERYLGDGY